MSDVRGFTLVEILVASAIAVIVAGTAFILLDAGLDLHEEASVATLDATGLAETLVRLRADISRASHIDYAAADSLALSLADGRTIAWAARPIAGGLAVYRMVDEGSGLVERPLRALIELADGTASASLRFQEEPSGLVRGHMVFDDRGISIEAAPWSAP